MFDNGLIVATTVEPETRQITFLDWQGNKKWVWGDVFNVGTERINIISSYVYHNHLTYQLGTRSYYIDLSEGSTTNKIRRSLSFGRFLTGFGDEIYYLSGHPEDSLTEFNTTVGFRGEHDHGRV